MPYSVVYNGQVIDVHFRNKFIGDGYVQYGVYVGDDKVGTVWGSSRGNEWTAHADAEDCNMLVDGFGSRRAAREFIIERSKYRAEKRKAEQDASDLRAQKFLMRWNMKKAYEIMKEAEGI
ncbi:hypothetical protein SEA_BEUFFERT_66 [Streptomyces phage Beuffert]|nr:hypothetical protein SEA_BEUFFERT_66 [Streptomyces phage Beuffert]